MPATASIISAPTIIPEAVQPVELRCFSYEDRRGILTGLFEAMTVCGCWVADKRAISTWQMEFLFDTELRGVDELYGELVSAGIEFTREAHLAMIWLCTLRRHGAEAFPSFRTVRVRLEMSFLQEYEPGMALVPRAYA